YLAIPQGENGAAIDYPYYFVAPSNTGIPTGFDLDNSGGIDDFAPNDAQGFGSFEGQFGFVIFSKHPIDTDNIRTFQEFLWKDMPGAHLPSDPEDADGNGDTGSWYTDAELEVLRLSSKNHVDLPVLVDGEVVHILAAHPTPPVFDGVEDRNGARNFDEIRFWVDYVTPGRGDYIYDDLGQTGGLGDDQRFVIVGDYNADPFDGDSSIYRGLPAAQQFLISELIQGSAFVPGITPQGEGGGTDGTQFGNPAFDTANFAGDLRVDYALPSTYGLNYVDGAVYWPAEGDSDAELVTASDHRLVAVDLNLSDPNSSASTTVTGLNYLGSTALPSGLKIGSSVLGGLSGIAYNPFSGAYVAISDDRADARAHGFMIDLTDGQLDDGDVRPLGIAEIKDQDGTGLEVISPDLEGIALDGATVYLASERDETGTPAIYVLDSRFLTAQVRGELPVDEKFLPDGTGTVGVQDDLGFESLTVSPDKRTLWTATESALLQDGSVSTSVGGSFARILQYDLTTGQPVSEFAYELGPDAEDPQGFTDAGLVELLALDNGGSLLALERSFPTGTDAQDYTGRLYQIDLRNATDVKDLAALGGAEFETVEKTLLADLSDFGIDVDTVEGMTLGPVIEHQGATQQSLILVSDDNFGASGSQQTQFIALGLELDFRSDDLSDLNLVEGSGRRKETLRGTAEGDRILGFGGQDRVFAGAGDDYIDTGSGNDWTVFGGAGQDTFVFGFDRDNVRILDFEDGVDRIELTEGLNYEDLQFVSNRSTRSTKILTSEGDRLILNGLHIDDLTEEDFMPFEALPVI
ncbi:MAG: esterase-like activity of phytase family protein, partial [Pseudomonadota bacterium]